MEKNVACDTLSASLEAMQASHKIEAKALNTIGDIITECKNREAYWLSNSEVPPLAAFVLYHASRNARIIFDKMLNRFTFAHERHENPSVVHDARLVFPSLCDICNILDSLKERQITSEMLQFIKKRVRILRNTAEKASMLPTIEEEVKTVNKKELTTELEELAADLRVNLV